MKTIHPKTTQRRTTNARRLRTIDPIRLAQVSGGSGDGDLSPQPLPPRRKPPVM